MDTYPRAAMERAMKVQDVMLQAMAPVRTHRESRQHGELSESVVADRADELASDTGGLSGNGASAFGRHAEPDSRSAYSGTIHRAGRGSGEGDYAGEKVCATKTGHFNLLPTT
jgi:hypothetical protein